MIKSKYLIKYRQLSSAAFRGSAIVLTVLAIAAMTTVTLGVASLVPKDLRQTAAIEASLEAENAALAGVEHALLMLRNNRFFELSESAKGISDLTDEQRPYGIYKNNNSNFNSNCILNRKACPGFDRILGEPVNQTPVAFKDYLSPNNKYELVVWHRRRNVGSFDLGDGLPLEINRYRQSANINPVLERDEVRRLDVRGLNQVKISWQIFGRAGHCEIGGDNQAYLVWTALKSSDNSIVSREILKLDQTQKNIVLNGASILELQLIVTNGVTTDEINQESDIDDCFIRYNLQSDISGNEPNQQTVDLGFNVVESTGTSGNVRRKIRVIVNRDTNQILDLFDYGLACTTCRNLQN